MFEKLQLMYFKTRNTINNNFRNIIKRKKIELSE